MISKIRLIISAAAIFFVGLVSYAMAQERAKAEFKNASGKTVGTAEFRETKEGVVLAMRGRKEEGEGFAAKNAKYTKLLLRDDLPNE